MHILVLNNDAQFADENIMPICLIKPTKWIVVSRKKFKN